MISKYISYGTLALISLAGLAGCTDASSEKESTPASDHTGANFVITILGDATRVDLLASISSVRNATIEKSGPRQFADVRQPNATYRFQSSPDDDASIQAALAWESDLILIAVDATQGPLPVHREHALVSRQMDVPTVVIAFTKSGAIDDPELLELEELEMRELLNAYALPGDSVDCVFDDQDVRTSADTKGPSQILDRLTGLAKRRRLQTVGREETRFKASIYSLTPEEAFIQSAALGIQNGPVTAQVGDELVDAEIAAPKEIAPGDNGEIKIRFAKPMRVCDGQRFLLINRQHVTGAGMLLMENPGAN